MTIDPAVIDRLLAAGDIASVQALATTLTPHVEAARNRRLQALAQVITPPRRHVGSTDIRLLVVSAAFSDCAFTNTGNVVDGILRQVARYYDEVSGGRVHVTWQLVGPITLPNAVAVYANGDGGRGFAEPNARTMVRDALARISTTITNFASFDTDGDGKLDAFVLLHAGRPAESFPNERHQLIWSHRGFRAGGNTPDGRSVDEFLTVSEDSPLGVWCHELGHLLFDWPDLIEGTDENGQPITHTWCLMSSGGWNGHYADSGPGTVPAHPCAPLKARQEWLTVAIGVDGSTEIAEIEASHSAIKLLPQASGQEYLFVENRQRTLFDRALAGSGLLVWSVSAEEIVLVPAGGPFDTYLRGTANDPFPGVKHITREDKDGIVLSDISESGQTMHVTISGLPAPPRHRAVGHQ